MEKKKICFICGNEYKIKEVNYFLKDLKNIEITFQKIDLLEIQGIPEEIVINKAKEAIKYSNIPILIEDDSFEMKCLGNLPGSYIKDFMKEIGCEGLYKIAKEFNDYETTIQATLGLMRNENDEVKIFKGIDRGIITSPKGTTGFGFDFCFQSERYQMTYGEMTYEEKLNVSFRSKAFNELKQFLISQPDYL